ncbi:hypothetical protein [Phenylobacterium sp.]|jgi:hypothetical protein
MAKSQKRSSREPRKPKQPASKAAVAPHPFLQNAGGGAGKKK